MSIAVYKLDKGPVVREMPFLTENFLDEISRQLPQGVYSTFRTYDNTRRVLGLEAHLDRLFVPATACGIEPSVSARELRLGIKKLLEAFQPGEARVRICLSISAQPGQVFVMLEPLKLLDEKIYQQGVKVVTSVFERTDPRIKATAFIQKSAQVRKDLLNSDIFEVLMVRDDFILEGMTSNFYAVRNSKIITARNGILLGVTRRAILRLLRAEGVPIEYRPLRITELSEIDEAFISSSSRGAVPVVMVDGKPVGQGVPGDVARKLRCAYDAYVAEKAESI